MAKEELPLAEEIIDTPSDLHALVLSFITEPRADTAIAIEEYLNECGREKDANEFLAIVRKLCWSMIYAPKNRYAPKGIVHAAVNEAIIEIQQLFLFDLQNPVSVMHEAFVKIAQLKNTHYVSGTTTSQLLSNFTSTQMGFTKIFNNQNW